MVCRISLNLYCSEVFNQLWSRIKLPLIITINRINKSKSCKTDGREVSRDPMQYDQCISEISDHLWTVMIIELLLVMLTPNTFHQAKLLYLHCFTQSWLLCCIFYKLCLPFLWRSYHNPDWRPDYNNAASQEWPSKALQGETDGVWPDDHWRAAVSC